MTMLLFLQVVLFFLRKVTHSLDIVEYYFCDINIIKNLNRRDVMLKKQRKL